MPVKFLVCTKSQRVICSVIFMSIKTESTFILSKVYNIQGDPKYPNNSRIKEKENDLYSCTHPIQFQMV